MCSCVGSCASLLKSSLDVKPLAIVPPPITPSKILDEKEGTRVQEMLGIIEMKVFDKSIE